MSKKRRGRSSSPELEIDSYCKGLYVADGWSSCSIDKKAKRAHFRVGYTMKDRDALVLAEPCIGTKTSTKPDKHGRYHLRTEGKKAVEVARKLAVTPEARRKVENYIETCRKKHKEGYTDRI